MADQVPLEELVQGRWYVGRGRNANVGLWDGSVFLVIGDLFGDFVVKREPYFTTDSGCFQPFRAIDEGEVVEPLGPVGWDAHYARKMAFGGGACAPVSTDQGGR